MNKYGVVGVIEAILLIGLFAIIMATVQIVYIPEIMKEREAEHMDTVMNQFSQLKMAVDMLSVSKSNLSITVPLTLGSRELPYFVTTRSLGSVEILYDAARISVMNATGYTNVSLGVIRYEAKNAYYVKQTYQLESGAIVLSQDKGMDTMLLPPSVKPTRNGNIINVEFLVINVTGYAGRVSETGIDTTCIRINLTSSQLVNISNVSSITIYTSYPDPWFRFFNYSLENVNIEKYSDRVEISPQTGYQINLKMNLVKISAQIGRGWIGNL